MIELRRYIAGDARLLIQKAMDPGLDLLMDGTAPPGAAWTLTDHGEVQACGGLFRSAPGTMEAWLAAYPSRRALWGHIARACMQMIADANAGGWTIEAHALEAMPERSRFLERLGFAPAGQTPTVWRAGGYVAYRKEAA